MLTPETIKQASKELLPRLVELRRDFHRHPELAFEEERTATVIQEVLGSLGIQNRRIAKTGVVGTIRGSRPGKTVLLRGDIDALPVTEARDTPYRSTREGLMHACGHDAHAAMLIGAADILFRNRESLAGNVKLAFQPAEENYGGAQPMIAEGILEDPHVDAVFGLHVSSFLPLGNLGLLPRLGMAASDSATITITGKGGHAAMPSDSVDATLVAAQVVVALQNIVSREIPPQEFGVVTVGSLKSGTVGNVISGEATLQLSIRSFNPGLRQFLQQRVTDIATGVATTFRAVADVHYELGYPILKNDPAMTEHLRASASRVLGEQNVVDIAPISGSEDFAYFLEERPGSFAWLGASNPSKGFNHPHHHPMFDIDEAALPLGVQVLVQTACDFLAG